MVTKTLPWVLGNWDLFKNRTTEDNGHYVQYTTYSFMKVTQTKMRTEMKCYLT